MDIFIRQSYRELFLESVRYCQREKGLEVGAWCIMSNHIHMIIGSDGRNKIQDIVRDLKSFTSRHIRKAMECDLQESRREWILWTMKREGTYRSSNKDFQLWQHHFHPIELNSNYLLDNKLDYIHLNPVKQGWVERPEHWVYSSARDYSGGKGLLEIVYLC